MPSIDFEGICERLREASDALHRAHCHAQAVARRYYLVYHCAYQTALQTGLEVEHPWRAGSSERDYRHKEMPSIVECLYGGKRRPGSVVSIVGTTPGVTGSRFSDKQVWMAVEDLRLSREAADYRGGPKDLLTEDQARIRLDIADAIASELRRLLK